MEIQLITKGEREEIEEKLTEKALRFCFRYAQHLDRRQAAIEAGYAKKSASNKAYQLLTRNDVRKYVGHLIAKQRVSDEVQRELILQELLDLARISPSELYHIDEDGGVHLKSLEEMGASARLITKLKTKRTFANPGIETEATFMSRKDLYEMILKIINVERVDITSKGKKIKSTTVNKVFINHRKKGEDLA